MLLLGGLLLLRLKQALESFCSLGTKQSAPREIGALLEEELLGSKVTTGSVWEPDVQQQTWPKLSSRPSQGNNYLVVRKGEKFSMHSQFSFHLSVP